MSVVLVQRFQTSPNSTIGVLTLEGSTYKAYTLEPQSLNQTVKPRAIPVGTYPLALRMSPRFGRIMPHVDNVPGFDGILIHWGNYPKDTEGCCLVGQTLGPLPDFIGQSRLAFAALFSLLSDGQITYEIMATSPV